MRAAGAARRIAGKTASKPQKKTAKMHHYKVIFTREIETVRFYAKTSQISINMHKL